MSLFFFIAALSESSEKLTISHPGARGRYRHNGLMMNTAQDVTDITCHHTYGLFLILNKSENATLELFAIYIKNYAKQECK